MFPDEIYIRRYRLSKADCFPNVDGHHVLMRVWNRTERWRKEYLFSLPDSQARASVFCLQTGTYTISILSLFSDIYTETWARTYAIFLVPNLRMMDVGFLKYTTWANYNKSTYLYMNLLLGLFLSRTQTNIGALLSLKKKQKQKKNTCGLPSWFSGKESAWQCRRHGFQPWSGKIPHAGEHLSSCTTTVEPVLQSQGTATTKAHVL